MTRDNLLFAIIGLLLGFIVGFIFASTQIQRQTLPAATARNQAMPTDHPPIGSDGAAANPAGMQAEVAAALDKARKEPTNFEAQLKAAELYYQIQRYDDAIGYLLKANQLKPDNYETIANLGMVNMDAGHYETAVKWYKAALVQKADDVRVLDGLCAALLGQGDAKAAEDAINKLARVDPNNQDLAQFREKLVNLKSSGKPK
jgi:tetratricopeptide (TPR) repeat protein